MFRTVILSAFLLLNLNMFGQTVKINYLEAMETDIPSQLSIRLDQKTYLKMVVSSDFASKEEVALTHYKCQDGIVSKTDLSDFPIQTSISLDKGKDSLVVEVMMQQVQDSVSIAFAINGKVRDLAIPRNYVIPFKDGGQQRYMLMETIIDTPVTLEDEIPLFAVTSGITQRLQYGEMKLFGQDYCGLRDKHSHPEIWHTVDGVQNYSFYTISFK